MNALANNEQLLSLKKSLPVTQAAAPTYKDVQVGEVYKTERYKIESTVVVVEVKKDQLKLKRDPTAKDSFTESRARFDKFYKKVR